MANEITPIRLITTDTNLRRVMDQINVAFKNIQTGNSTTVQNITNINTYLDLPPVVVPGGGTADSIMSQCTIALVNGDYDLTYDSDGNITVDG